MTVRLETYFSKYAKTCDKQPSFQKINPHFRSFQERYSNKNFSDAKRSRPKSFKHKNEMIPFKLMTVRLETYFSKYAKSCDKHPSYQKINPHFRSFQQRYSNQSFSDTKRCRPKSFKHNNEMIPFKLMTLRLETYFSKFAKTCDKQPSFQKINPHFQSFQERYSNQSFSVARRSGPKSFKHKKEMIPFKLMTVQLETYFSIFAKTCDKQPSFQKINPHFRSFKERYSNQSFSVAERSGPKSFKHKNEMIPFKLMTVRLETYFSKYAKSCDKQPSFRKINPHFRSFQERYSNQSFSDTKRSRPKSFKHKNKMIPFKLMTVRIETCFLIYAKTSDKQPSFRRINPHFRSFQERYSNQSVSDNKRSRPKSIKQNNEMILFKLMTVGLETHFRYTQKLVINSLRSKDQSSFSKLSRKIFKPKF